MLVSCPVTAVSLGCCLLSGKLTPAAATGLGLSLFDSTGSARLGESPQNFLVQPGMPDARQRHLLHASCQLSPGLRRAPLSSAPQPDWDWGKAEAPITRTQTSSRLFMLVLIIF